MQGDIKNRNGRVYPMEVLTKKLRTITRKFVNEKRAYGELGHPRRPNSKFGERVSHLITIISRGKNIMGEARILETPMGKNRQNFNGRGNVKGVFHLEVWEAWTRGTVPSM